MFKKLIIKNGFTLIEMLVVIAIFGMIVAAASFMFNDTRKQVSLQDAQANILNALEKARNQSATGFGSGDIDYGVNIYVTGTNANSIIPCTKGPLDASCIDEPDKKIDFNEKGMLIVNPPSNTTVIFNRLSATSNADVTITVRNNANGQDATVTVSADGTIEK